VHECKGSSVYDIVTIPFNPLLWKIDNEETLHLPELRFGERAFSHAGSCLCWIQRQNLRNFRCPVWKTTNW